MQVSSIAALSLGLVYQGTANGDAVEAVLQVGWAGQSTAPVGLRPGLGCSTGQSSIFAALLWPGRSRLCLLLLPIYKPCASAALSSQALMLRGEADLTQPGGRLMCLALGLLFLHRQGAVDATLEVRRGIWFRLFGTCRQLVNLLNKCMSCSLHLSASELIALCCRQLIRTARIVLCLAPQTGGQDASRAGVPLPPSRAGRVRLCRHW